MSLSLQVDTRQVERLANRIGRLGKGNRAKLMESLAAEGETQTRRRITDEKTTPDGEAWPAWSEHYARTRNGGQSLLQGDGDLVDSITSEADSDMARWGSPLVYAAIHNLGGTPDMAPGPAAIPAREYLGLSDDNSDDMEGIVDVWLDEQIKEIKR